VAPPDDRDVAGLNRAVRGRPAHAKKLGRLHHRDGRWELLAGPSAAGQLSLRGYWLTRLYQYAGRIGIVKRLDRRSERAVLEAPFGWNVATP
jgi:hypothetical protein